MNEVKTVRKPAEAAVIRVRSKGDRPRLSERLFKQRFLLIMSLPFFVWVLLFCYLPLLGWSMAFQDFKLKGDVLQSYFSAPFVGLKHFEALWEDLTTQGRFFLALRNTLAMSLLLLAFGFVSPIIFALMLNELRAKRFKRITQTISYLPHFISWVVAAGMISVMLSTEGPINDLLVGLGLAEKRVPFLADQNLFWGIMTVSEIWKELGWNAIIFLAAITSVDQGLYESAEIDGAGRLRKIWYVTLPCIMPVITVILIMDIGWLISVGFEKQMLLGNDMTRNTSEVLDVYALKYGIGQSRYSFGTAIGMFKSVVSVVMVLIANALAKKTGDTSIL
ncbi:MAG: ABC transporter permease subunit [Oscillospiraceae bacterium]|jgi:putative aldouronate transport system permease protein|nr:ABC transporter permease subunit [Oscillospiraceae bacterium]